MLSRDNHVNNNQSDVMPPKNKGGHPRLFKTAKELEDKINEYFESLEDDKKEYINSKTGLPVFTQMPAYYGRLLIYIGCTYQTIEPYEDGEYDDINNQYSEVLTRARMLCEADLFEGAARSIYDSKAVGSALQRHHGYAEVKKLDVSGTVIHQMQISQEQAEKMLADAMAARQERLAAATVECDFEVKS